MKINDLSKKQARRIADFIDNLAKGFFAYGFLAPYFDTTLLWYEKFIFAFISLGMTGFLLFKALELDSKYD